MFKKAAIVLSLSFLAYVPAASANQCFAFWVEDTYACTVQYGYESSGFFSRMWAYQNYTSCMSTADFNYDSCSLYAD